MLVKQAYSSNQMNIKKNIPKLKQTILKRIPKIGNSYWKKIFLILDIERKWGLSPQALVVQRIA